MAASPVTLRAAKAFGNPVAELHLTREVLFMEDLPEVLTLWEALNQKNFPGPRLRQLGRERRAENLPSQPGQDNRTFGVEGR